MGPDDRLDVLAEGPSWTGRVEAEEASQPKPQENAMTLPGQIRQRSLVLPMVAPRRHRAFRAICARRARRDVDDDRVVDGLDLHDAEGCGNEGKKASGHGALRVSSEVEICPPWRTEDLTPAHSAAVDLGSGAGPVFCSRPDRRHSRSR